MLLAYFKMVMFFLPLLESMRGFSHICHKNLVGLLEIKLTKVWGPSKTGPCRIFNC